MKTALLYKTFNAMKRRLGGWKLTPREKLLVDRKHLCPGWVLHNVARSDRVFSRRSGITYRHGHLAYSMYWRLHKDQQP